MHCLATPNKRNASVSRMINALLNVITRLQVAHEAHDNFDYNAANGIYGDMVEKGVLDPAKVTRSALQNAASIASLMLTTDAIVAESVEEKSAGGSMGDMGA